MFFKWNEAFCTVAFALCFALDNVSNAICFSPTVMEYMAALIKVSLSFVKVSSWVFTSSSVTFFVFFGVNIGLICEQALAWDEDGVAGSIMVLICK